MPDLTQIAAGGVVAVLVLKEATNVIKAALGKRRSAEDDHANAGAQTVDFWRKAHRDAAQDAIALTIAPILNKQTEILARMDARDGEVQKMLIEHGFVLGEVRKDMDRIRAVNHDISASLQRVANKP